MAVAHWASKLYDNRDCYSLAKQGESHSKMVYDQTNAAVGHASVFQGQHKLHVSSVAGNPELVCVIHCFVTH